MRVYLLNAQIYYVASSLESMYLAPQALPGGFLAAMIFADLSKKAIL